jgi:hypothetical protein
MEPWRFCKPVVADLHHFHHDAEQEPDPNQRQSVKLVPDPHQNEKWDPDPHQRDKSDPDPQQGDAYPHHCC